MTKNWCYLGKRFIIISVALLLLVLAAVSIYNISSCRGVEGQSDEEIVTELAQNYYSCMLKKDYRTGLGYLYRKENTLFTDDFLIQGYKDTPLLEYEILDVKKLADNVYGINSIAELDDGNGQQEVTNYAIYKDDEWKFVIHWSDVPEDMYDFRVVIGY